MSKITLNNHCLGIFSFLPAPSQPTWDRDEERKKMMAKQANMAMIPVGPAAPPYGQRQEWIPRNPEVCTYIYFHLFILAAFF